ncbi:hypothetical protein [Owenweeksia hongkongensis]|uniref:hypothetical protein n=1 Tax=Owenweeksia hongkongensis TaxID=253245 RepID=UPI003A8E0BDE
MKKIKLFLFHHVSLIKIHVLSSHSISIIINVFTLDIPSKFDNSILEKKFSNCSVCNGDLTSFDQEYLIEKAYKRFPDNLGEELLFEIAVCFDCAGRMKGELSKESLENISTFFQEKSFEQKQAYPNPDPSILLNQCLLSGKNLGDMQEYQVYAHCRGGQLADPHSYYMLSDEIIEEIQGLLSDHTRDQLQKFSDDNIGMPPELKKLFSNGDLIIL